MLRLVEYESPAARAWRVQEKDTLRYGVEIETGWAAPDHRAAFFRALEARHLDRYCISKPHTTGPAGVEVITRPLVFLEAKRVTKGIVRALDDCPAEVSLRGCGLHVHTTRAAWSEAALVLVRTWVADPDAGYFLDGFVGRDENAFCVRSDFVAAALARSTIGSSATVADYCRLWRMDSAHSDAVSLSLREPTVEFRLFQATRHVRIAASYLDLVDALLRYAESFELDGSTPVAVLPRFDPAAFTSWVAACDGYQALKWRLSRSRRIVA